MTMLKTSTKTTTIITTPIISATKQLQKYATKDALNKAEDEAPVGNHNSLKMAGL